MPIGLPGLAATVLACAAAPLRPLSLQARSAPLLQAASGLHVPRKLLHASGVVTPQRLLRGACDMASLLHLTLPDINGELLLARMVASLELPKVLQYHRMYIMNASR